MFLQDAVKTNFSPFSDICFPAVLTAVIDTAMITLLCRLLLWNRFVCELVC